MLIGFEERKTLPMMALYDVEVLRKKSDPSWMHILCDIVEPELASGLYLTPALRPMFSVEESRDDVAATWEDVALCDTVGPESASGLCQTPALGSTSQEEESSIAPPKMDVKHSAQTDALRIPSTRGFLFESGRASDHAPTKPSPLLMRTWTARHSKVMSAAHYMTDACLGGALLMPAEYNQEVIEESSSVLPNLSLMKQRLSFKPR